MAKKIAWTKGANRDRREILAYWRERNKSDKYSIKLNQLFISAVRLIAENPKMGLLTDIQDIRMKTVKEYRIFYKEESERIIVLVLWDTRRNPGDLTRKFHSGA